jgi:hypothetical protein
MLYLDNLKPEIVVVIPLLSGAFVQVIKPIIGNNRKLWLPLISVVTGIILTVIILHTPPDLLIALLVAFSGLIPSAAQSVRKEMFPQKREDVPLFKFVETKIKGSGNPTDHL